MKSMKNLKSDTKNLSISTIPNDKLNVVIALPKEYELSTRVIMLLEDYNPSISQKPSPDNCPNAVTANVPKALLTSLIDLLSDNVTACLDETTGLVAMMKGLISNSGATTVDVQRSFWKQLSRSLYELKQYESTINMAAAAARATSMPISNTAQSIVSNEMLATALSNKQDNFDEGKGIPSEYVRDQQSLRAILNTTLENNPQTLGVAGTRPPTNLISFDSSDSNGVINIGSNSKSSLVNVALQNAIQLYSNVFLNIPLVKIKELGDLTSVKAPTRVLTDAKLIKSKEGEYSLQTTFVTLPIVAANATTRDATANLDVNKSILEQDWTTTTRVSDFKAVQNFEQLPFVTSIQGENVYINPIKFASYYENAAEAAIVFGQMQVVGVFSNKAYNIEELYALGMTLKALWERVKNIKLPSAEQVEMAGNLLAAGLGAIGRLTGSAGLVKASDVLKSWTDGFGELIRKDGSYSTSEDVTDTTASTPTKDTQRATILYHANSIIPNLIRAGYESFVQENYSAQSLRQKLASQAWSIQKEFGKIDSLTLPYFV